jgi:hydrogenase expression/formation protein HypD
VRFVDEFHDVELARTLANRIADASTQPIHLMEFCGSHTHALLRYGIRDLLPSTITMHSGPGCPVCVTSARDIDTAIAIAELPGVTVATYGDLVKVPGSRGSLERARARGADVRIVYSAIDAIAFAEENPSRLVVLVGIGFETTAPTIAASLVTASQKQLHNYRVLSLLKLTPPVMRALLALGELRIDGILCPGHVSVIIGTGPYEFIPREHRVGCAVAGFEPLDILRAIDLLVRQAEGGSPSVENAYERAVAPDGNQVARALIDRVFSPGAAEWRGLGSVPDSGLILSEEFSSFDALREFRVNVPDATEPPGCRCGDVLRGGVSPDDCPLFGTACTPKTPVGPCMVSHEGACAAYYSYTIKT